MAIYSKKDFGVELKVDEFFLILVDQVANEVICWVLEKLFVQYFIILEENKVVFYEICKNYDYYWLVDFLDGIKEFIKCNGEFIVNIVFIYVGKLVMGVVYVFCFDEIYWGVEGVGVFLEVNGKMIRFEVLVFKLVDEGLNVVCFWFYFNDDIQAFVDKLKNLFLVFIGSFLKFLIIVKGEVYVYLCLGLMMEWDMVVVQAVLE